MSFAHCRGHFSALLFVFAILPLSPGAAAVTVHGTVRHASGPLQDARVELLPIVSPRGGNLSRPRYTLPEPAATAVSDGGGRFSITAPAPGMWKVLVRAPGYVAMELKPLTLVEPRELAPVVLSRDHGAELWVVAPAGTALVGVEVRGVASDSPPVWRDMRARGWDVAQRVGRIAADGRIVLPRAANERLDVSASLATRTGRLEGTTGGEIRLAPAGPKLTGRARAGAGPAPAPPPRIRGRVLEAGSHRPLAGAVVWHGHDPGAWVLSDAEGRYRIPAAVGESFWVQAEAVGHLPRYVHLGPEQIAAGRAPSMALPLAIAVGGKVVDAHGRPLSAVVVEAIDAGRRPFFSADTADARAWSAADGSFRLAGVEPGRAYRVRASRPGYAAAVIEVPPSALAAGTSDLKLVLTVARAAFGHVVDEDQRPIQGAEAILRAASQRLPPMPSRHESGDSEPDPFRGRTTPEGRFELDRVPAERVDLTVYAPGYAPLTVRGLEVPPGQQAFDLGTAVLVRESTLAGRVVDPRGEALAGAAIHVLRHVRRPERLEGRLEQRLSQDVPETRSDAAGRFTIEGLAYGEEVQLLVDHESAAPVWVRRVGVPAPELVTVVMEPGLAVVGEVMDTDEAPIEGAEVHLLQQRLLPGTDLPSGKPEERRAVTGSDGRFTFPGLEPGRARVRVVAPGFVPGDPREVELAEGRDAEALVVLLERGHAITGRVTTTAGEPIAAARILAGPAAALSDAEGHYRVTGVALGALRLAVAHRRYGRRARQIEVEPGENLVDLTFPPGRMIRGRTVDAEARPLADVIVRLSSAEPRDSRWQDVRSQRDGTFELGPVTAGTYHLRAERPGFAARQLESPLEVTEQDMEAVVIRLQAGARIRGRVLGLEQADMAHAEVTAEDTEARSWRRPLDYEGRYELTDLAPGVYQLEASFSGGKRSARARVWIRPGELDKHQDLVFDQGFKLSGRVSYDDAPLEGAKVSVRGTDQTVRRMVRTNYLGEFGIDDLTAGTYRFDLASPREHLTHEEWLEIDGDRTLSVDLYSSRVSGVIVDSTKGRRLAQALVLLERRAAQGQGSVISMGTGEDGTFVIPRVPAGRYVVRARKDGYSSALRELEVHAGVDAERVDLELEPTAGLVLRPRFAAGRAPFVGLAVAEPAAAPFLQESRPVDADGHVRLPSVPPGDWEVQVAAPGYVTRRVTVRVPGPAVELELFAAGELRVRVPELFVSEARAELVLVGTDARAFSSLGADGVLYERWNLVDGTARVGGLPDGQWMLEVRSSDGRAWAGNANVVSGALADVVLE